MRKLDGLKVANHIADKYGEYVYRKTADQNLKYRKLIDKRKDELVKKHRCDVKYFIRVPYTEPLNRKNIKNILVSNNII